jgi:hypothetical protein
MSLDPQTILKLKDRILPAHNNDSWWPRWQLELNLSLNEVVSLKNRCKQGMPVTAPVKGDRIIVCMRFYWLSFCSTSGIIIGLLLKLGPSCELLLDPEDSFWKDCESNYSLTIDEAQLLRNLAWVAQKTGI